MMYVMVTDIAGKPVQHFRQIVVGATFHRRLVEAPLRMLPPVGVFELMLDVEEPDTESAGQEGDGQLDQKESLETHS